jgi:hypothetical protein
MEAGHIVTRSKGSLGCVSGLTLAWLACSLEKRENRDQCGQEGGANGYKAILSAANDAKVISFIRLFNFF